MYSCDSKRFQCTHMSVRYLNQLTPTSWNTFLQFRPTLLNAFKIWANILECFQILLAVFGLRSTHSSAGHRFTRRTAPCRMRMKPLLSSPPAVQRRRETASRRNGCVPSHRWSKCCSRHLACRCSWHRSGSCSMMLWSWPTRLCWGEWVPGGCEVTGH